MTDPLVYIIILNWNGYGDTRECLLSLGRLDHPRRKVIVVDNASADGSAEKLSSEFDDIEVLRNDVNLGFAGGNNTGIRLALERGADLLMLLNNDTVVSPDMLPILAGTLSEHPEIGIVGPKILYYGNRRKIWFAGGKIMFPLGNTFHVGNHSKDASRFGGLVMEDYQTGCCMLVRASVFRTSGLFDPGYSAYFEDADLCMRASRDGFGVACQRNAVMWHKVSGSTGGGMNPGKARLKALNGKRFFKKHANRALYLSLIPFFALLYIVFTSLKCSLEGRGGVFTGFMKGLRETSR